jgi:cbb3-type cytochrome oxidase maturation protein
LNSIYLLIPLSLVLVGAAVWAFFWAVNSGQFEDLDEPGRSVLDDEVPAPSQDAATASPAVASPAPATPRAAGDKPRN